MMIHEITSQVGTYKKRKRLGRGIGSGHGKTCGRGHKGAGSRSGYSGSIRPSREGGQMAFFHRVPIRGFSNFKFRTEYAVVNVKAIADRFEDGEEVNPEMLVKRGVIRNVGMPVKVLGEGELTKRLNITAAAFSKSASDKITAAGGTVNVSR